MLPVLIEKTLKVRSSTPLPGTEHWYVLAPGEGQASHLLAGITHKIPGQEIVYYRKKDSKKRLGSHRFCPKYHP